MGNWRIRVLVVCSALCVLNVCGLARAEDANASPHSLWVKALYVPKPYFLPSNNDGYHSLQFSGGDHVGVAAGYGYRIAESISLGVAATIRGYPGGAGYESANVFSIPLLVSFDPHLSQSVRLMMTAGLGYQHGWGNSTYGEGSWQANGLEAMAELGVAVRVAPKFELLSTVGVSSGLGVGKNPNVGFYNLAVPIGLGIRYAL